MKDEEQIKMVARIMEATQAASESELARRLGMNVSTVSNWRRGCRINFEGLLEAYGSDVDWNYIMTGKVRGGGDAILAQVEKLEAQVEILAKNLQRIYGNDIKN